MGVGVKVAVAVGEGVAVGAFVDVGVAVRVGVEVCVAVGVPVGEGVAVGGMSEYSEVGGVKLLVQRAMPLLKRNSSIQPLKLRPPPVAPIWRVELELVTALAVVYVPTWLPSTKIRKTFPVRVTA